MGRQIGQLNTATIQFVEEYDRLLATGKYESPVEILFKLTKSRTQSMRYQAASKLLEYRYPKSVREATITPGEQGELRLSWGECSDEQPEPIDVEEYEVLTADDA